MRNAKSSRTCGRKQIETSSLPTDSSRPLFKESPSQPFFDVTQRDIQKTAAGETTVQANRDFFYIDCKTVYFNCKYFP